MAHSLSISNEAFFAYKMFLEQFAKVIKLQFGPTYGTIWSMFYFFSAL